MPHAMNVGMAAVFALVFVPALAAALLLGFVGGGLCFSTAVAGLVFVALATGMVAGLFRLARQWEDEDLT